MSSNRKYKLPPLPDDPPKIVFKWGSNPPPRLNEPDDWNKVEGHYQAWWDEFVVWFHEQDEKHGLGSEYDMERNIKQAYMNAYYHGYEDGKAGR